MVLLQVHVIILSFYTFSTFVSFDSLYEFRMVAKIKNKSPIIVVNIAAKNDVDSVSRDPSPPSTRKIPIIAETVSTICPFLFNFCMIKTTFLKMFVLIRKFKNERGLGRTGFVPRIDRKVVKTFLKKLLHSKILLIIIS